MKANTCSQSETLRARRPSISISRAPLLTAVQPPDICTPVATRRSAVPCGRGRAGRLSGSLRCASGLFVTDADRHTSRHRRTFSSPTLPAFFVQTGRIGRIGCRHWGELTAGAGPTGRLGALVSFTVSCRKGKGGNWGDFNLNYWWWRV